MNTDMTPEELARWGLAADQIESIAQEFENGTWKGPVRRVPIGRPRIFDEELVTVSFRMPKSRALALRQLAQKLGRSRSTLIRSTLEDLLAKESFA